jgi:hypothetical protein
MVGSPGWNIARMPVGAFLRTGTEQQCAVSVAFNTFAKPSADGSNIPKRLPGKHAIPQAAKISFELAAQMHTVG